MRAATRGLSLQIARKIIQLSALSFVVYAAASMHWRNAKVAHNSSRLVELMSGAVVGRLYAWNEALLSMFGEPLAVSDGFLGVPWAATVGGVPTLDPLALAALTFSGNPPSPGAAMAVLLPVSIALVASRVFCSFLCPARLLFELSSAVRQGLVVLGLPLPAVRIPRLGLWVGLGALAASLGAGAAVFHLVLPYLALSSGIAVLTLGGGLGVPALVFGAMWATDLLVAPGQICRSLCPTGAVLGLLGRRAPLRVLKVRASPASNRPAGDRSEKTRPEDDCPKGCAVCQRVCPYGLLPREQQHHDDCDRCGRCVVACPSSRLSHGLKMGRAVGLALAFAGLSLPAHAHHNKGLPHYGYFENYPQVPTEDMIAVSGRWEFGGVLFNFQGLERRTSDTPNDVKFFIYAYDLDADATFRGPITFEIHQDEQLVSTFTRVGPDGEGVYITRETLPASGWYDLTYRFEAEDGPVVLTIPFEVDLAADAVNWPLIGGLFGGTSVVFGLAVIGRRRRLSPRSSQAV